MHPHHEKLGKEPISTLLYKMSLPAAIGLFVMSLYHLVDTIFVGRGVGPLAIAGVSITFPIQMIGIALAQTLGIGAASIISRSFGSQDKDHAEKALGSFIVSILTVAVIYTVLGLVFIVPLMKLSGATPDIIDYAVTYMRIMFFGMVFFAFASASNSVIRSEGNAKYAMVIMVSSALLNVILDYIFIFPMGWGVAGAAWASVISQVFAAVMVVYYLASGMSDIKISLRNFLPDWKVSREMFAIGASSFARMSVGSIIVVIINNMIGVYGGALASVSIAAFGIINRVIMVVFLPILGLVQGLQPVLGFNYGAKHFRRAHHSVILSIKSATILSIFAFIVLMIFTKQIMSVFTTDAELLHLAVKITKIIAIVLPIIGFQIVTAGLYQALGKALPAFIISILRQVIIFLPLIIFLPRIFGYEGIWYAFPAADFLAGILTFFMLKHELKLLKKAMA